jgi:hypothetical protein
MKLELLIFKKEELIRNIVYFLGKVKLRVLKKLANQCHDSI